MTVMGSCPTTNIPTLQSHLRRTMSHPTKSPTTNNDPPYKVTYDEQWPTLQSHLRRTMTHPTKSPTKNNDPPYKVTYDEQWPTLRRTTSPCDEVTQSTKNKVTLRRTMTHPTKNDITLRWSNPPYEGSHPMTNNDPPYEERRHPAMK